MPSTPPRRILHMHIPKTAGTALRSAFEAAGKGSLRIFPHWSEREYAEVNPDDYDFYSGHFGYQTAARIGGEVIAIYRHPVDRFASVYYFWRTLHARGVEISTNTKLATRYSLGEFAMIRDEPTLLEEFYNRMTWQTAHGSTLAHRRGLRETGATEDDVCRMAMANAAGFAVVGTQDQMGQVARRLAARFGVTLRIRQVNVTEERTVLADLGMDVIRRIHDWVQMDLHLYEHVSRLAAEAEARSSEIASTEKR
jgi:hypothetical protein